MRKLEKPNQMKTTTALFASLLFSVSAFAQPTIQWQKSLGGSDNDYAYSIQQTTDGGYIVEEFHSPMMGMPQGITDMLTSGW